MKAWVLEKIGDISLKDVKKPVPGKNEVLIRVAAAGICGSDIPRIYETGAHRMPLIPGHEFSGVAAETGEGVSQEWVGKKVAVFPKIACKKCKQCVSGRTDLCTDYDYIGSRRDGAFAEYVTAPAENLLRLPENVSLSVAAMTEPMAVSANAVRTGMTGGVKKEDPVAVCGLGPIGLMTVMFLKEAGFDNIFAIGNKDLQRKKAKAFGVSEDRFINSSLTDPAEFIKESAGSGTGLFFECVGRNESIETGIRCSAPEGNVILVGNPYSDMSFEKDVYWKILRDQITLKGIWNSKYFNDPSDDWNYVIEKVSSGRIDPEKLISHRLSIDELDAGFSIMKERSEDYTKILSINSID